VVSIQAFGARTRVLSEVKGQGSPRLRRMLKPKAFIQAPLRKPF